MDETDVPASSAQNVLAVHGVAYGVIGADLHVFGDEGLPVYRLASWRPPPDPLCSSPAVRPRPQAGIEQLRGWRDSGPRLRLRWLHGAGETGAPGLAACFAAESVRAGWKTVAAADGPGDQREPGVSEDLRPGHAPGCLVLVGEADRWPLRHLTWLLSNSLFHQAVPVRVLLLARTLDAWPSRRAAVACLQADTSSQFAGPRPA